MKVYKYANTKYRNMQPLIPSNAKVTAVPTDVISPQEEPSGRRRIKCWSKRELVTAGRDNQQSRENLVHSRSGLDPGCSTRSRETE